MLSDAGRFNGLLRGLVWRAAHQEFLGVGGRIRGVGSGDRGLVRARQQTETQPAGDHASWLGRLPRNFAVCRRRGNACAPHHAQGYRAFGFLLEVLVVGVFGALGLRALLGAAWEWASIAALLGLGAALIPLALVLLDGYGFAPDGLIVAAGALVAATGGLPLGNVSSVRAAALATTAGPIKRILGERFGDMMLSRNRASGRRPWPRGSPCRPVKVLRLPRTLSRASVT